jgi:hypothetical protein
MGTCKKLASSLLNPVGFYFSRFNVFPLDNKHTISGKYGQSAFLDLRLFSTAKPLSNTAITTINTIIPITFCSVVPIIPTSPKIIHNK